LLPSEHDAAWAPERVDCREVLSVRFLDRRADGALVAVSHWNKHLKGALVRLLLEQPSTHLAELARWEHPAGYPARPGTHGTAGSDDVAHVRRAPVNARLRER